MTSVKLYTVKVEFFVSTEPDSYYSLLLEMAAADEVLGDPAASPISIDRYAFQSDGFGTAYEFSSNQTTKVYIELDFDILWLFMYQITDIALNFSIFDEDGNLMGISCHQWAEITGAPIISFIMDAGKVYTICINLNGYAYYEPVTYSLSLTT
ncbi:MAG: hypothetical protein FWH57_05625 [Oscillospiraceae bacterium]|nr:hypothetical protein [Oscillospiraceae bacterium]